MNPDNSAFAVATDLAQCAENTFVSIPASLNTVLIQPAMVELVTLLRTNGTT